jgi:hypothetical protein
VILLGVALHLPALHLGFMADDWGQQLTLEQPIAGSTMQPWSLYDFGTRASIAQTFGDDSVMPWWTDPEWKARFFRPLTSVVLWGESELLGRNGPARHALGLLWQALFLTLAWRLFRTLGLTHGRALLALAVLACEDGAMMSVGWLANRNSLLEGVASAGALLAALRARERGGAACIALALGLGALAFGAKESGLAAWLGCLFLWARAPAPAARRGALVAGACFVLALVFLLAAGYGTRSLFYPTPWGDPLRYARHLVGLVSGTPLALLGPWPLDALEMVPGAFPVLTAGALVVLYFLRGPLGAAARRVPHAPALLLFALASLGIQACALPSDRLLFVPALALAPFVALLLEELCQGAAAAARVWRVLGRALVVTSLPLSALFLVLRGALIAGLSAQVAGVFATMELEPSPLARRDVLLLSSPTVLAMLSPQAGWRFATGERQTRFHPLQMTRRGLALTRIDAHTLEIESLDEPFLTTPFEGVFLGAGGAPTRGEVRTNEAFEFEFLDGPPARRVRVRGREELGSTRYRMLAWREGRWRAFALPAPGERLELVAPEALSRLVP